MIDGGDELRGDPLASEEAGAKSGHDQMEPGDSETTSRLEAENRAILSRLAALEQKLTVAESTNPSQRIAKLEETVRNVQKTVSTLQTDIRKIKATIQADSEKQPVSRKRPRAHSGDQESSGISGANGDLSQSEFRSPSSNEVGKADVQSLITCIGQMATTQQDVLQQVASALKHIAPAHADDTAQAFTGTPVLRLTAPTAELHNQSTNKRARKSLDMALQSQGENAAPSAAAAAAGGTLVRKKAPKSRKPNAQARVEQIDTDADEATLTQKRDQIALASSDGRISEASVPSPKRPAVGKQRDSPLETTKNACKTASAKKTRPQKAPGDSRPASQEKVNAGERESGEFPVLSSDKMDDQSEGSYDLSEEDDQWTQLGSMDLSGKQLYLKMRALFTAGPLQLKRMQALQGQIAKVAEKLPAHVFSLSISAAIISGTRMISSIDLEGYSSLMLSFKVGSEWYLNEKARKSGVLRWLVWLLASLYNKPADSSGRKVIDRLTWMDITFNLARFALYPLNIAHDPLKDFLDSPEACGERQAVALLVTHVLLCRVAYVAQARHKGAAEAMDDALVHLYRARAVLLELVSNCTRIRHIATATACLASSWPEILPKRDDKQGTSPGPSSPPSLSTTTCSTGALEISMQYLVYEWYITAANSKFIDHESMIRDYPYNSNMEKESAQYVLEQMRCESFFSTGAELIQPLDLGLDAIMEALRGALQYFKQDFTNQTSKTFSHQSLALLATFPLSRDTGDSSDARSIAWQKALSALDAIPILVGARSFYWTWETFIRLKLWIGLADKSRHGGTFLVALVLGRILLSDAVRAAKPFAREAILSLLEQWFMYCIDKTNAVQSSSTPASRSADKPASSLSFSSNA